MTNFKWKTKSGKVLKFSEMEDSHILNCIAMLERRAKKGIEIVCGDVWCEDGFDNWGDVEISHDPYHWAKYGFLRDEARRRKLIK